jgi:hypothetical protein
MAVLVNQQPIVIRLPCLPPKPSGLTKEMSHAC